MNDKKIAASMIGGAVIGMAPVGTLAAMTVAIPVAATMLTAIGMVGGAATAGEFAIRASEKKK